MARDARRAGGATPAEEAQREARRLVDEYGDLALRLAYTYLGSLEDAQDVSQDVLCKLVCRREPFRGPEHERAWVIRCTANACKDVLRSASRRREVALDAVGELACATGQDEVADSLEEDELPGRVTRAVMGLPPLYREAVYLHYYEGMSIAQIARSTEASQSAVAKRLSRAREELRERLEGKGHGEGHGAGVPQGDGPDLADAGAAREDGAGGRLGGVGAR